MTDIQVGNWEVVFSASGIPYTLEKGTQTEDEDIEQAATLARPITNFGYVAEAWPWF